MCVWKREQGHVHVFQMCFNTSPRFHSQEDKLNRSNLHTEVGALAGRENKKVYILSVTSLPKSPGVPLPSDRNPSGELEHPPPYNKASWTRGILLETFEVGLNEWKKRKCHIFHLRRFQIGIVTMKVHQREMQTPQSSKGSASSTFRVIK